MNSTSFGRKAKQPQSPPANAHAAVRPSPQVPSHMWKSASLSNLKLPPLAKLRPAQPVVKRPVSPKKRSSVPVPLVPPSDKPTLDDFRLLRVVGTGTFSKVRLALCRRTQEVVVIKIMHKGSLVKMRQVDHVKNEKSLLASLKHPFMVNLRHSFQDRTHLYLELDYVPGGEVFRLLRLHVQFPVKSVRFYGSEVVCVLAYLHSAGVVYRDLKPENLLITQTGHIKVTDFGFAKSLKDSGKTFTLCGTPEYLAPEVIQQRGHSYACDWWGVGILLFELACGHAPFQDANPFRLYEKIINTDVDFPSYFDPTLQSLVELLLDKNPDTRIDEKHILEHVFFRETDWAKVAACELSPPYVPHVRSADDTSNFDDYPDEPDPESTLPVAPEVFANF